MTYTEFLQRIDDRCKVQLDRAVALLWFVGQNDPTIGLSARDIANILREAGHPQQNVSRLDRTLRADRRTAAAPKGSWALRPATRKTLDTEYAGYISKRTLPTSQSIVPLDLFTGTRGYIERVADQINKSFDVQLYDCCAVMCRRLLETLIIEMYERQSRESEIQHNGHYVPLSDLVLHIENDRKVSISKLGMKALKDFKRLGDLSAHNRRYNARESDILPFREGIRIVSEEMLHIAELYSSAKKNATA